MSCHSRVEAVNERASDRENGSGRVQRGNEWGGKGRGMVNKRGDEARGMKATAAKRRERAGRGWLRASRACRFAKGERETGMNHGSSLG